MSEYEHAYMFTEILQTANASMANYMAIVFGMLVASYFAAHRIDRIMVCLGLGVYSVFCMGFINEISHIYHDFGRIGAKIQGLGQVDGTSLGWMGPALMDTPLPMMLVPKIITVMVVAIYIASLLFFFRARKANVAKSIVPKAQDKKP